MGVLVAYWVALKSCTDCTALAWTFALSSLSKRAFPEDRKGYISRPEIGAPEPGFPASGLQTEQSHHYAPPLIPINAPTASASAACCSLSPLVGVFCALCCRFFSYCAIMPCR